MIVLELQAKALPDWCRFNNDNVGLGVVFLL
jgi:hypothetical protein